MTRVVVLADTHLRAGGSRCLPSAVLDALAGADAVIHAGDLLDASALDVLARHAPGVPVHAVRGNHDGALADLPERLEVDLGGVRVGVVHDPGPSVGRARRLRRWFPAAEVVVFGHTHAPCDVAGEGGQRLCNPGSPTERRRQPACSYGVLEVGAGRVTAFEVHALAPP